MLTISVITVHYPRFSVELHYNETLYISTVLPDNRCVNSQLLVWKCILTRNRRHGDWNTRNGRKGSNSCQHKCAAI